MASPTNPDTSHLRCWAEIDLSNLRHNAAFLRKEAGDRCGIMAIVKADAYGHGSISVAQTALEAGASWLGVATVPEGIQLRESGIDAPILILGATHTKEQIQAIAEWNLQATLCSPQQALIFSTALEGFNNPSPIPVHIKLDTGMSRLGPNWEQAAEFVQLVQGLPQLQIASIYSHLATADSEDTTIMKLQQSRFETAVAQLQALGITAPCYN